VAFATSRSIFSPLGVWASVRSLEVGRTTRERLPDKRECLLIPIAEVLSAAREAIWRGYINGLTDEHDARDYAEPFFGYSGEYNRG
jgi:hypothetical protein